MVTEVITKQNYEEYMDMIPHELDRGIVSDRYKAIGVKLVGRPVGAAVWEGPSDRERGSLLSLFVTPAARRLGGGTELFRTLIEKIREDGIEALEFSYVAEGDRLCLTPFFEKYEVALVTESCPLGRVNLKEVLESLTKKNIKAGNATGKKLSELSREERPVVDKWIHKHINEYLSDYLEEGSLGYVTMKEGNVESALLFSTEFKGTVNLSYTYAAKGGEVKLPGLMASAVLDFAKTLSGDTVFEMLLVNEASKRLYEGLFGPAPCEVEVVHGAFM